MDPYLEDERLWPSFQHGLITCLQQVIHFGITDQYTCRLGERCYITEDGPPSSAKSREEVEAYIEIQSRPQGQLVTLIDMVRPANKITASGRAAFLATRQYAKDVGANLVEVDLVLQGRTILEYPPEAIPTWDYAVSVTRTSDWERHEFYVATLPKFLPCFRLPLGNDQRDLVLDLQGIFTRCYYQAGFNDKIDYGREPTVPLGEENRRWLAHLLTPTQQRQPQPESKSITAEALDKLIYVADDFAGDFAERTIQEAISQYNQIKETAYQIWLQEGCPHGRDVDHWQRAIQQLKNELKACYEKTRSTMDACGTPRTRQG